jgi:hypothetical protein
MGNIKLPGGRRATIWTSSKPSGGRKAWSGFISIQGKAGSAKGGRKKK